MISRARPDEGQEGFILIEVLVSAVILAIVAGAVLTLITATTHSAASGRNQSVAYGLAQEDQARLRTERISNLKELDPAPREETVGGTTFYVESRGEFVNDHTGTASCSGEGASADYVELTSTVSSPALRTPVSIHSVVSPSNESLNPSHGTFIFQAKNAGGEPLSGVSISGTGPGNFTRSTNEEGCVTFADVPAGDYQITSYANGLVNPEGKTNPTLEIDVEASATQQHVFYFDHPGTVKATFEYLEPKTAKLAPAAIDSMLLFNAENEDKAVTLGTPGGATAPTFEYSVYPLKTAYTVYAGSCESNNPDPEEKGVNTEAFRNVLVTSGNTAMATIQVPALNLVATYENKKVKGATVYVTDTRCQYNTKNVRREFKTDKVGHIEPLAASTEAETEAVGLPYGEYKVCVQAFIESRYRWAERTLSVKSLASPTLQSFAMSGSRTSPPC